LTGLSIPEGLKPIEEMTVIAAANRCTTQSESKIEFSGNLLVSLAGFQALHALVEIE